MPVPGAIMTIAGAQRAYEKDYEKDREKTGDGVPAPGYTPRVFIDLLAAVSRRWRLRRFGRKYHASIA